jgi:hypothetical protein
VLTSTHFHKLIRHLRVQRNIISIRTHTSVIAIPKPILLHRTFNTLTHKVKLLLRKHPQLAYLDNNTNIYNIKDLYLHFQHPHQHLHTVNNHTTASIPKTLQPLQLISLHLSFLKINTRNHNLARHWDLQLHRGILQVDSLNRPAHINKEEIPLVHSPITNKHLPRLHHLPRFLDYQVRLVDMIHSEPLQVNNSGDHKVKGKEV